MSCRRRSGYSRLVHRLTAYWGILKWPSLGEFGWPPGLVNSGRTRYEVQQILGHSDPKVTQRYSH